MTYVYLSHYLSLVIDNTEAGLYISPMSSVVTIIDTAKAIHNVPKDAHSQARESGPSHSSDCFEALDT